MKLPIYLDYNSTTPADARVVEAMLPYFSEKFGNAASKTHRFGWVAEEAVEQARKEVARLINAEPAEIIFTSGATEAINLAIKGVFEAYRSKGNHIITVSTEHKAVLDTCKKLEKQGASVTYLGVNGEGFIDFNELEKSVSEKTILITVMFANNEIGVIQPIGEIADVAHRHNLIFMSDATQAAGKTKVDVQEQHIDLMPLSAHKIYGPKGVGALYVRRRNPRVALVAQMHGGGHEKNLRSGTLNVAGIVGMGKACEIARAEWEASAKKMQRLRDKLQQGFQKNIPDVRINGSTAQRIPNTLNISFKNVESHLLMKKLVNEMAVASGSACTSAVPEPSYVLRALGLDDETAYASVRFSLGKTTTEEEIDFVVDRVSEEVSLIRESLKSKV